MSEPHVIEVPLLPLDGLVLFPGTVHRLHIFERRHRQLVADALGSESPVAVALLRPGWEENYFGAPPVHRTAGMGVIVDDEALAEGRFIITLEGRRRIRLLREIRHQPYRVAEAEVVEDVARPEDRETIAAEIAKIERLSRRITELFPQFLPDLAGLRHDPEHAAQTVDQVAHRLVRDVYDRQSILDETDVGRRVQLTRIQLSLLLQRFLSEADYRALVDSLEGG